MSRDGAAAPPDVDRRFFVQPILTSPYEYPARHWELDEQGQPTQRIIERRRTAQFITPIPKPRKRKGAAEQREIVLDEGKGLSTEKQQYDPTPVINQLRNRVDAWRSIPNPDHWQVTPETRRLLQHWRHHPFASIRPFFCQIEAIETLIWLTEGKASPTTRIWRMCTTRAAPALRRLHARPRPPAGDGRRASVGVPRRSEGVTSRRSRRARYQSVRAGYRRT